jgi:glycine cleavage system H protein
VRIEADGSASVGITAHAAEELGDMVFAELPKAGCTLAAGEEAVVLESVKAAADVYAPAAGVVEAANDAIVAEPEQINADPYAAWLFRFRPAKPADLDGLMDAAAYEATL